MKESHQTRAARPRSRLLLIGIALILVAPLAGADERPNILFLFTDDQRADTVGAWGNERVRTPNIDRLARDGISFRANYNFGANSAAVCAPSRAMIHTGRVWLKSPNSMHGVATLPQVLGDAGYQTFITGKWHNGEEALLRSYQRGNSVLMGGMADHSNVPVADIGADRTLGRERVSAGFSTEIFADAAVRFLRRYDDEDPFFAYVSFTTPHDPRDPPPGFVDRHYADLPPLPPNFLPQHPFDNGELVVRDEVLAAWPRPERAVRQQIAEYYGLLDHLDEQIGRVLEALRASPHAESTIVVFASDHGLALGGHGLMGKQNLYEHSVRCPLILSGPGLPRGESSTALTYLHDLVPTLAGIAGVEMPHDVDGEDLRPLWEGTASSVRNSIFHAYKNTMRTIRDERYKLHVYPYIGHRLLFDLREDPHEMADRAGDRELAEVETHMLALLRRAQADYEDSQTLEVEELRPKTIDLTGMTRTPDIFQPRWIVDKYF